MKKNVGEKKSEIDWMEEALKASLTGSYYSSIILFVVFFVCRLNYSLNQYVMMRIYTVALIFGLIMDTKVRFNLTTTNKLNDI